MSRLLRRLERLEQGSGTSLDICAQVPACWSDERREAEVAAILRDNGLAPPIGMVVYRLTFFGPEGQDDARAEVRLLGEPMAQQMMRKEAAR